MRERDQGSKNPGLFLSKGRLKVVRFKKPESLIYERKE
jgi:hypothetical protein